MSAKKMHFLPNLFTAASLSCGVASIALVLTGNVVQACWLIFFATILDSVDGTVARLTRTQSAFGEQFDSLSDACVFGVAPGVLFFHIFAPIHQTSALLIMMAFTLAAVVRLARFNLQSTQTEKYFFQGLPTPAAAVGVMTFSLMYTTTYSDLILRLIPYMTLLFAALMVSKVPYVSSKYFFRTRTLTLEGLFILFVYMWLLITLKDFRELILLAGVVMYVSSGFIIFVARRGHAAEEVDVEDAEDLEVEDY